MKDFDLLVIVVQVMRFLLQICALSSEDFASRLPMRTSRLGVSVIGSCWKREQKGGTFFGFLWLGEVSTLGKKTVSTKFRAYPKL